MKKQLVSMTNIEKQNFRIRKISLPLMIFSLVGFIEVNAQTLQEVTNNGASTNKSITAKSYLAVGGSFSGSASPSNINSLSGFQILGDIADVSQNGITYSSGGGGGAAIGFFRGGSYGTGIDFYTNYAPVAGNLTHALRIDSYGSLGLGTTTPTEKLDVNGNVKVGARNAYLLYYGSLSEAARGASTILGNNVVAGQGDHTIKRNMSSGDNGSFVSLNYHHGITFHTGITSALDVDVPMYDSEKMRITQNGDVGIGTNTPREKLSVNGKIRAQEIKVETANWPDYVFADDYQQQTLPELERYIKANKHLPEVPSAKEVEQNGIALGEMNKILLKKIEELTLHLIEKDKALTELTKRIERLEKKD